MRMKLIDSIFLLYLVAFITITFIGVSFYIFSNSTPKTTQKLIIGETTEIPIKHISKMVTIIMREFELQENDVTLTVYSFLNIFPKMQIYIMYDELPYPPLDILINNTLPNVKFFQVLPSLKNSFEKTYPLEYIKTKYVLFVPDSTRITSTQSLQIMLDELEKRPGIIVTASLRSQKNVASCLLIDISIREWTLRYSTTTKKMDCDGIFGKHLILVELLTLRKLANIFLLPFPQSFYIQTAALSIKVCKFIFICFKMCSCYIRIYVCDLFSVNCFIGR